MPSLIKHWLKKMLPARAFDTFFDIYHFGMAVGSAALFGFPSRKIRVVGVTGTKGKSSTVEMIGAIAEAHGWRVALLNSIRTKIGSETSPNTMRMSMPGRAFIQRFIARAVAAQCDIVVLEMTSEGARQHRHRGIALDALVFTNLAPEHIESHGSFEKYADAKYELGLQLVRSSKRPRIIVANADDAMGARFLTLPVEQALPFSLSSDPTRVSDDRGGRFHFGTTDIIVHQPGEFSLKNALAAATVCRALGIPEYAIARGIASVTHIPGRAERIEEGQPFAVIIDYAHTPDSLEAIYRAYPMPKIAVLGSMGGSRDGWNRPEKARIAAAHCRQVILTNEDPCDDNPRAIIAEMERGLPSGARAEVIVDRREAIRAALRAARPGEAVIITGKGTDPWIYGAGGTRIPWSDAGVAREELRTLLAAAA